jgi:hypothetical protein
MRYAPKSGELRNIRRVDYVKKISKGQTRMWQVHFTFKGRTPISQPFSDNLFCGRENALVQAKRFRNAMEHEFAASETRFGKFGLVDLTPEVGVSRSSNKRKTLKGIREHWYWQTFWPGIEKKDMNRKFYDSKYGSSEGAKKAAMDQRRHGCDEYLEHLARNAIPRLEYLAKDADARTGENSKRAPYALFMPPANLDVPVWRYMDFTKFVSLLENKGLFFPMVSKLHDPFEGSFARGNENLRPMVYRHVSNPYGLTAGEVVQKLRDYVAVSCWHINERESAAMWKLYSKSNEAVCIQTTFRKLNNAVRAVAQVGEVRYVDYETSWIPESNPLAPFIYKRLSFEHEREIRAIIPPNNVAALLAGKTTKPSAGGHWVSIELPDVIERILVAPDAPAWLAALVRRVTDHYQFNSIPVVPSTLSEAPFY